MKVTLINTADAGGGAAEASMRLLNALTSKQVDAHMQVQQKKTHNPLVVGLNKNFIGRLKGRFNFLYERLPFMLLRAKNKSVRFAFSTADIGTDISKQPVISTADILHLHWTNSGFLSIKNLRQLFDTRKPIVWTLHDMWAFTGGCHYSGDCHHFTNHCGNCWMLRKPEEDDLSFTGWMEKKDLFTGKKNIVFITCSSWLADVARSSSMLKGCRIETIPNPIDTELFSKKDKQKTRRKWNIDPKSKIILFGSANINDRRKGLSILVRALDELKAKCKEPGNIGIVLFGKNRSFDSKKLPFKVHELKTIRSQEDMAELYSLADVFVTPAIEDNLPNTVMESLSCGTPVVAFDTGGIPEMVVHKENGYLAKFKSAADFAAGIDYVLNSDKKEILSANGRKKVLATFTNDIVATKYLAVYQSMLKPNQ